MAVIEKRDPGGCCVPTGRGGSRAKVKGRQGCRVIVIRPGPSSKNRSATNRVGSGNLPTEVVRGKHEAGKKVNPQRRISSIHNLYVGQFQEKSGTPVLLLFVAGPGGRPLRK